MRDAPLRGCLEKAFALPDDSPAAEEARQQGLAGVKPGPDLEPWVRPKALGSKEGLLLLHFSGAGGSSVVQWAQSKLGLERHKHASGNANWGPQSRNDGWVSLAKAAQVTLPLSPPLPLGGLRDAHATPPLAHGRRAAPRLPGARRRLAKVRVRVRARVSYSKP